MTPDPLQPFPRDDVVWEGRPALGLHQADLVAGLVMALGAAPALVLGLWLVFEVPPARATGLGLLHAALLGLGVALGRAVGAGPTLVAAAAFTLPVLVAAALAAERTSALFCAGTLAGAVTGALVWRYRQRRALYYQVSADRVALGERGRYTIVFPRQGDPVVRRDRFGGPAEVVLPPAEARLVTRDGKAWKLPAQPRRLVRIADPERLRAALAPSPRGG